MTPAIDWSWLADLSGNEHFLVKLGLSMLLGILIGLEREASHKPAGVRTHTLVALGATLFTIIGNLQIETALSRHVADPNRVLAQIVTGVGFLGAGTILVTRGSVRGLTTAASIWIVSAIGAAVGAGYYRQAIGTTLISFCVLQVLGRLHARGEEPLRNLELVCALDAELSAVAAKVHELVRNPLLVRSRADGQAVRLHYQFSCDDLALTRLLQALQRHEAVSQARSW